MRNMKRNHPMFLDIDGFGGGIVHAIVILFNVVAEIRIVITKAGHFIIGDGYLQFHIVNRKTTAWLLGQCTLPDAVEFLRKCRRYP